MTRFLLLALATALAPLTVAAQASETDDAETGFCEDDSLCAGVSNSTFILAVGGIAAGMTVGILLGCAPIARPRDPGHGSVPVRSRRGVGLSPPGTRTLPHDPLPSLLGLDR